MEIVSVKVPAKLKRTLEEQAESEGRPTGAVVVELLEKVESARANGYPEKVNHE
jgi:hypothetical protein